MLKVYIIEDDNNQRERLTSSIEKIIEKHELGLEVALSTGKIKDLVCSIEGKGSKGLYFLDIDLGEDIHGLELAQFIRKHDPNGYIIFVTTHSELNILTFKYKVEAMDFIVKDDFSNMERRLEECLVNVDDQENASSQVFKDIYIVDMGEKSIGYEKDNIIFFEGNSHSKKIILHGINRQIEFNGNLKEIEDKVGKNFFRVSRTVLINIDKAETVALSGNCILMKNGETCKIGLGRKSKLLKLIK